MLCGICILVGDREDSRVGFERVPRKIYADVSREVDCDLDGVVGGALEEDENQKGWSRARWFSG